VEISKLEIGDRGTDSPVLWDHKAFLFDRSRNLLVMPILEAKVDVTEYPEEEFPHGLMASLSGRALTYSVYLWMEGSKRGKITHVENIADPEKEYYYYYSPLQ
jgi:inhibitor of cysteine peptidase